MFAVYASEANPDDPLAALAIGDLPEPEVPEGWLRIKISHVSLNRPPITAENALIQALSIMIN
jgi:NADPH:quinone reductase-like Zn-dependent oxidoreductase